MLQFKNYPKIYYEIKFDILDSLKPQLLKLQPHIKALYAPLIKHAKKAKLDLIYTHLIVNYLIKCKLLILKICECKRVQVIE